MHIPDGLMSPIVVAGGWVLAVMVLVFVLRKVNKELDEKQIPIMAVLAAGIFVAQMLNFPVGGGTTGHLIGAALAVILLGPFAGILIISVILVIQLFLFGDGGITALGLNILNMAIIGCSVGWFAHRIIPYKKMRVFAAAWLAVFIGALFCALELAVSYGLSGGTYGISASISIPTMLGYHAVIGVGEGIITVGIVSYLAHVSPETFKIFTPVGEKE